MKTLTLTLASCLVAGSIADAAAPFGATDPAFNAPRFTSRCYPTYCRSDGRGGLIWSFVNAVSPADLIGANGVRVGGLVRTTESGVLDTNFVVGPALQEAMGTAIQADGKILVGARWVGDVATNGAPNYRVFRILTNGVLDTTYRSPVFGGPPRFMTVQSDAKLLAATGGASDYPAANGSTLEIARLTTDGSQDATFTLPLLQGNSGVFAPPVVDTNGMIYLAGGFTLVNGQARQGLVRLYPNGALDYGFMPGGYTFSTFVRGVLPQPGGKVVIAGRLRLNGDTTYTYYPLMRLNSDGSFDNTFTLVTAASLNFNRARLLMATSDGKMLTVSHTMARFNNDGSLDTSFVRLPFGDVARNTSDIYRECYWFTQLADGRFVMPNDPTVSTFPATINGQPFDGSVRLWPNGTLDPAYSPPVFQSESFPTLVSRQQDGKLLVGGNFDRVSGATRSNLVRFAASGAIDTAFTLSASDLNSISSVVPLSGGSAYVLGQQFDSSGYAVSNILVRLQPDGSVDPGFSFTPIYADSLNYPDLVLQGDKPVVAAGMDAQAVVDGILPLQRFATNGVADTSFSPSLAVPGAAYRADGYLRTVVVGDVQPLAAQPDGKLLVATTVGPYPENTSEFAYRLLRLNANGTIDSTLSGTAFSPATSYTFYTSVNDPQTSPYEFPLVVAPNRILAGANPLSSGRTMVWGAFSTADSANRPGIARLLSDGSLDPAFPVGSGPAITGSLPRPVRVDGVSVDANGRIWVMGNFTQWDGVNANGFVRLNADGSVDRSCLPQASYFALDDYYQTVFSGALPGTSPVPGGPDDCLLFGSHLLPGDVWPRALSRLVAYPSPSLRSAGMLSGFGYGMTLDTLPDQLYKLQASPDLKTWQDWFLFQGNGGTAFVCDPASMSATQRFYRAAFHP